MIVNQLVGSLVGQGSGPVLVVGGAPSVPAELEALRKGGFDFGACRVISANEHAMRAGLKPHFACVNDDTHSVLQTYQEPRMRELMPQTKLLSRHWWADYRSPQLMACNSGLKAILYAAILGANPVVVIGIQHYRDGLYFHEPQLKRGLKVRNPNMGRDLSYFAKQTNGMKDKLTGVPVRPVSGPLTSLWKQWSPSEKFGPRGRSPLEVKAADEARDTRYVHVRSAGFSFQSALVPEGAIFAATRFEMAEWKANEELVDVTGWDLSDKNEVLARALAEKRAEQARLRGLIAKLRGSRRSISRSIYDADIVRVVKWVEGGESPESIARRTGMPKEQVQFMVQTMGLTVK